MTKIAEYKLIIFILNERSLNSRSKKAKDETIHCLDYTILFFHFFILTKRIGSKEILH